LIPSALVLNALAFKFLENDSVIVFILSFTVPRIFPNFSNGVANLSIISIILLIVTIPAMTDAPIDPIVKILPQSNFRASESKFEPTSFNALVASVIPSFSPFTKPAIAFFAISYISVEGE